MLYGSFRLRRILIFPTYWQPQVSNLSFSCNIAVYRPTKNSHAQVFPFQSQLSNFWCLWSAVCTSLLLTTANMWFPGKARPLCLTVVRLACWKLAWWRLTLKQQECFGEAKITAAAAVVLCRQLFLCDVPGNLIDPQHELRPAWIPGCH